MFHAVVVGAGAFGGWTALHLLRKGVKVTLLDGWGPGNSRSSSGGETRLIRSVYGPDRMYVDMAVRSLQLWKENESRWGQKLYHRTGFLRLAGKDDSYEKAGLAVLRAAGVEFEQCSRQEAARRYPQMDFDGVNWVIYERDAGYLTACQNCQTVVEHFQHEGGEYRQLAARPGELSKSEMKGLSLSDGQQLVADCYMFACGPWLGQIFPEVIGNLVQPTKQEVFFYGTPPGDTRYHHQFFPGWVDKSVFGGIYGVPAAQNRGLKLGCDIRGAAFDPTMGERLPDAESVPRARSYLALRLPGLRTAPLIESRVCQYEDTPDRRFIIDRHPQAINVWFVGGGSGHGYKHGPAIGERAALLALGSAKVDPLFALSRLRAIPQLG